MSNVSSNTKQSNDRRGVNQILFVDKHEVTRSPSCKVFAIPKEDWEKINKFQLGAGDAIETDHDFYMFNAEVYESSLQEVADPYSTKQSATRYYRFGVARGELTIVKIGETHPGYATFGNKEADSGVD